MNIKDKSSSDAVKEFLQLYFKDDKEGDILSFGHAKCKEDMKIVFNDPLMFNKKNIK